MLHMVNTNIESCNHIGNQADDINWWHRKLGHISEESIRKTVNTAGSFKHCSVCAESNFPRPTFKKIPERIEKVPLERVYSDICGPMQTSSHGGAKYFAVFVDGFSGVIHAATLKNKNEVLPEFKKYVNQMENQSGYKLKYLSCDNGGEFSSKEMK